MKKLIITSALLAFVAAPVLAQTAKESSTPTPVSQQPAVSAVQPMTQAQRAERMAEHQAKTYEQQYKLSPEQYKGVYSACLDFAKSIEAARSTGKQTAREDIMAALEEKNKKFKVIMTPEQYKAYDATLAHTMPQQAQPKPQTKN